MESSTSYKKRGPQFLIAVDKTTFPRPSYLRFSPIRGTYKWPTDSPLTSTASDTAFFSCGEDQTTIWSETAA